MSYLKQGRGSSYRAIQAANEGRVPESKINAYIDRYPIFLQFFRTKKEARQFIIDSSPTEWHHTGKYGNKTFFYDLPYAAGILLDMVNPPRQGREAKAYPRFGYFKEAAQSAEVFRERIEQWQPVVRKKLPAWVRTYLKSRQGYMYFNYALYDQMLLRFWNDGKNFGTWQNFYDREKERLAVNLRRLGFDSNGRLYPIGYIKDGAFSREIKMNGRGSHDRR